MRFVVVDIETTGLSPEVNEIIEIGAVRVELIDGKYQITDSYQQLVKSYRKIPPVVRSLTGINEEMLKDAPRFHEIGKDIIEFIGDDIFVAHNVLFDLKTVNASLKKHDLAEINNKSLDTQDLVSLVYPMMFSHKLSEVVKVLGIELPDAHRALADAEATAEVLIRCLKELSSFPLSWLLQVNRILQKVNWPIKKLLQELQDLKTKGLSLNELTEAADWKKFIFKNSKMGKSLYKKKDAEEKEVDVAESERYFAPNGDIKKIFEKYEYRPQQQEMSQSILSVFNNKEHLLIEAGTGTGKSMAYLLPVLLWIKQNGGPIIVSTRTKNLQSQLIDQDIPAVVKLFPEDKFNILVMKGRQNYLCIRRFELLLQQMVLSNNRDLIKAVALFSWFLQSETGDISELHPSLSMKLNSKICSEHHSCLGEKCTNFRYCYLQQVRKKAKVADLIIANHSLVLTDLVSGNNFLPKYHKVVFDEAHSLEDAITEAYTVSVSFDVFNEQFRKLAEYVKDKDYLEDEEKVRSSLAELFELLRKEIRDRLVSLKNRENKILIETIKENKTLNSAISLVFLNLEKDFNNIFKKLEKIAKDSENENIATEISAVRLTLADIVGSLQSIYKGEKNYVNWLEFNSASDLKQFALKMAPVDIGEITQEYLFLDKESVVLTSATITVDNKFDYIKEVLGIKQNIEQKFIYKQVGSPFAYDKNLFFSVVDDLPEISKAKNTLVVLSEFMVKLFKVMKGRTLTLFTSYEMMTGVFKIAKELLTDTDISIVCQGKHGSRRALLKQFKTDKKIVLFGTDSFWEGVDVPGDALSCVLITKLPFSVPTEPVVAARIKAIEEKGHNAFFKYYVPQAVIKFRQGVGRLIRSHHDKGLVIVLDRRISTKNYGSKFINSLPDCHKEKKSGAEVLEDVEKWLKIRK